MGRTCSGRLLSYNELLKQFSYHRYKPVWSSSSPAWASPCSSSDDEEQCTPTSYTDRPLARHAVARRFTPRRCLDASGWFSSEKIPQFKTDIRFANNKNIHNRNRRQNIEIHSNVDAHLLLLNEMVRHATTRNFVPIFPSFSQESVALEADHSTSNSSSFVVFGDYRASASRQTLSSSSLQQNMHVLYKIYIHVANDSKQENTEIANQNKSRMFMLTWRFVCLIVRITVFWRCPWLNVSDFPTATPWIRRWYVVAVTVPITATEISRTMRPALDVGGDCFPRVWRDWCRFGQCFSNSCDLAFISLFERRFAVTITRPTAVVAGWIAVLHTRLLGVLFAGFVVVVAWHSWNLPKNRRRNLFQESRHVTIVNAVAVVVEVPSCAIYRANQLPEHK